MYTTIISTINSTTTGGRARESGPGNSSNRARTSLLTSALRANVDALLVLQGLLWRRGSPRQPHCARLLVRQGSRWRHGGCGSSVLCVLCVLFGEGRHLLLRDAARAV